MKLYGQDVDETDTHVKFNLRDMFWGASKVYKWINKEPGIGISLSLIRYAYNRNKKLMVTYNKVSYEISPVTINNFYKSCKIKPVHYARNNVRVIVTPNSKFTRVEEKKPVVRKEQESLF